MPKKLDEIVSVAKKLSLGERAELAGTLLLSLDETSGSEVERLWLKEAERRIQEYREGNSQGRSAGDVFREAFAKVR